VRTRTRKQVVARRREILGKLKLAYGCDECNKDPRIWFPHSPEGLNFAHLDQMSKSLECVGKPGTNKAGMGMNRLTRKVYLDPVKNREAIKAIFLEIRKCRVLCSNHHGKETKERGEHKNNYVIARARLGIPEPPPDTQEDMFYDREEQEMETKRLH
tara:strand:- start:695 stop:1165 length:471 start_codon:yes stop_codon:yes gene_type:complete